MLYVIVAIVVLLLAATLIRVRVRLDVSNERRVLFVGLGRTGREQDFVERMGRIKLFGVSVKKLPKADKKEAAPKVRKEKKPKKKKPARRRALADFAAVVPGVFRALRSYLWSLAGGVIVEKLEGEIDAGFESPDMTGRAYGYYQAALAAWPGASQRFRFIPDWNGPSFRGSAMVSLAIPVYRIVLSTTAMLFRLPLRKLIKLAIGKKKGDQDGQ